MVSNCCLTIIRNALNCLIMDGTVVKTIEILCSTKWDGSLIHLWKPFDLWDL